jgi:hypothetical protein
MLGILYFLQYSIDLFQGVANSYVSPKFMIFTKINSIRMFNLSQIKTIPNRLLGEKFSSKSASTFRTPSGIAKEKSIAQGTTRGVTGSAAQANMKVRLGFKPGHPYAGYPGIMRPLAATNGVLFPYRPSLTIGTRNYWGTTEPKQSLYGFPVPDRHEIAITITDAQMSAQSVEEADYIYASIQFFRAAMKPAFGSEGSVPLGAPAPTIEMTAIGPHMIQSVGVILRDFDLQLMNDVDYIPTSSGATVPSVVVFTLGLMISLSASKMRSFNLDEFVANGQQGFI